MKKFLFVNVMLVLAITSFFFAGSVSTVSAKEPKILEFDTMAGLPATLTGTQASASFRGVNAGGLPWALTSAHGELKASGKLEIEVTGLVFSDGPNTGKNTIPFFRAIVSCVTSDGSVQNVMTDPFPASIEGNAEIEAMVNLPQPCFAPIVFVTSPGGAWFAVTGN